MTEKSPLRDFTILIAIAVLGTLILAWWIGGNASAPPVGGLQPGQPAPQIEAQGWINGRPPAAEELQGQVVVVEAWAWWCGPCRQKAPELIETYEEYRDRGVVFIGLTAEGEESLGESRAFLEATGIPWPNGYGALETLQKFEAHAIPTVWVIGRDGKVVWNIDSPGTLADGIEQALAADAG